MWLGWDRLQEKVKMEGVLLWEGRWVNESTQIRLWPISPGRKQVRCPGN